jgi:hypothetical protein
MAPDSVSMRFLKRQSCTASNSGWGMASSFLTSIFDTSYILYTSLAGVLQGMEREKMTRFLVWLFLGVALTPAAMAACPYETEEIRITEALTEEDTVHIIMGEELDKFVKNANDLWNIGWQRAQISHIYAIEAEQKAHNEHFQIIHLFFIGSDGCIAYYQTVYKAVLQLALADDPQAIIGHRQ